MERLRHRRRRTARPALGGEFGGAADREPAGGGARRGRPLRLRPRERRAEAEILLPAGGKASLGGVSHRERRHEIYVSDSTNPVLYRLAPDGEALEPFRVTDQRFVSLQGMALSPGAGARLLVADYALGLFAIDLASRRVSSVSVPSGYTLLGLDGLAGTGPFIATQNGVNPSACCGSRSTRTGRGSRRSRCWRRIPRCTMRSRSARLPGTGFVYVGEQPVEPLTPDGSIVGGKLLRRDRRGAACLR